MPLEHPPTRDVDMPEGMSAQPGEGDVEEAFAEVMPPFPDESDMAVEIADGDFLDAIDEDHAALVDELEAAAADRQDRADRAAVRRQERADADAASMIDDLAAGLGGER